MTPWTGGCEQRKTELRHLWKFEADSFPQSYYVEVRSGRGQDVSDSGSGVSITGRPRKLGRVANELEFTAALALRWALTSLLRSFRRQKRSTIFVSRALALAGAET